MILAGSVRKYGVALLALTLALLARQGMDPWLGDRQPFATLYAAIALCVWYGGWHPAMLISFLGYLACDYLFTHPRQVISIASPHEFIGLAAYAVSCTIIIGFGQAMRAARKKASNAAANLAALNEQLSVVLDNAPVAIWVAHDRECRRVDGNAYAKAAFGPDDPAPGEGRPTLHRGAPPAVTELMKECIAKRMELNSVEVEAVRKDGLKMALLGGVSLLRNRDGSPRGAVATCVDMRDRKRAEEALLRADRRKDEFLATVAHELRNPLAPLRTTVSLMRRMTLENGDLQELRDVIDRQVGQMARLLDDLLDVSRVAAGKIVLRKEIVHLGGVVDQAVEACRPLINSKGHHLTVCMPASPHYVEGDPARLAQIVGNLLTNAAKYTDPGGSIRIGSALEDGLCVLRVKDNGIGIDPNRLQDVFGMFVQADGSSERMQGGLGIGLSLVRRLVALHKGTVEIQSRGIGHGCEAIVRLPASKPPVQNLTDKPRLPPNGDRQLKVLIADDNVDTARLMELALQPAGYRIQTAKDGLEALNAAKAMKPDVALLDLGMPGLDGYKLGAKLRSELGDRLLLVAMTGRSQEEDRRRALEAGFDHFLTKPTEPETIERLLMDHASERKPGASGNR